jgi:hypothetical protein
MARCSGMSSDLFLKSDFTVSHRLTSESSVIKWAAFCDIRPTRAFTKKLECLNKVRFNVNGTTKRAIKATKSWSNNPGVFSPVEDDFLGNREKIVENTADGLPKRLLIAAACSCSNPRSLLIYARSSSKFVTGKSIFYKFLNIF